MNNRLEKRWIIIFLITFLLGMAGVIYTVLLTDPFFHFHAPQTESYYYQLSNQRSQNDGITRHFDYTGIITGTSVTKNFKVSQADALFKEAFIKIPYDGASYRDINESIARALERNPGIKMIVRGLDLEFILAPKDYMSYEMDELPGYLYDSDWLNDIRYVLNRDVFFTWTSRMIIDKRIHHTEPGITSFDEYGSWILSPGFRPDGIVQFSPGVPVHLTAEQEKDVRANVRQNITDLADLYQDTEFCYFIPPNCMVWWYKKTEDGSVFSIVEAEKIMMEEVLQHSNIRLFTWNNRTDLTGNLDNYEDSIHFDKWINEFILQSIKDNYGLITRDNYEKVLEQELKSYLTFDYPSMVQ